MIGAETANSDATATHVGGPAWRDAVARLDVPLPPTHGALWPGRAHVRDAAAGTGL